MTDNEIRDRLLNAFEWLEEIKGSTSSDENYENADIIQKFINCYQTEINRQKAEIERLEKEQKALLLTIERARKERVRIQTILVNFMDEIYVFGNKNNVDTNSFAQIAILGSERDSAVKQIKSEAYREFWMKLRTHGHKMMGSDWSGEFCAKAILVEDGDNLLKELTESK